MENILLRFCDKTDVRSFMHQPWKTDDGSYVATTGHIMIVCNPEFNTDGVEINASAVNVPDHTKPFTDYPNVVAWHPLPDIPICQTCKGDKTAAIECEECKGQGKVMCNYEHYHECEECDGDCRRLQKKSESKHLKN